MEPYALRRSSQRHNIEQRNFAIDGGDRCPSGEARVAARSICIAGTGKNGRAAA